jgi:MarR-like DNA-binding transcriptional regulator SgrR of sgrS sRNA
MAVDAARPHYGGTLRVEAVDADWVRDRATPLAFESLVRVDADRVLRPMLAESWDHDAAGSRWQFRLRRGVALHDGTMLAAWQVAASLRALERGWKIAADGDTLTIEPAQPSLELAWLLADAAHGITVPRGSATPPLGTGPFRLERQDAAAWSLRAHDDYRGGRPFLDAVQIQIGRPPASPLADLEAGRTDFAAIQAVDARRLTGRGLQVVASKPLDLVALAFEPHRAGDAQAPLRRTVSQIVNRGTIADVLLQQRAAPAVSFVPQWIGGSEMPAGPAPPSRASIARLPPDQRELTIRVDANDPQALAIAERIAVDARESGLTLRVQAPTGLAPRADMRIVRIPVDATAPGKTLAAIAARLGSRADATASERALLDAAMVVPIVHLHEVYGAAEHVGFWNEPPIHATGVWNFADVWLRNVKP